MKGALPKSWSCVAYLGERVQLRMLQDEVRECPGPRPLQRVEILVPRELPVHAVRYVVAHVPQSWVPRRRSKCPLQHLQQQHEWLSVHTYMNQMK